MHTKRRITVIFMLASGAALSAAYVARHDLPGRYRAYRQQVEQVRQAEMQAKALEQTLANIRARRGDAAADPLELERALRRVKGVARENERVYRIEQTPAPGGTSEAASGSGPGGTEGTTGPEPRTAAE